MAVLKSSGHGLLIGRRAWLLSAAAAAGVGASSGAVLTPGAVDTRRVFQRDVAAGNPAGFATGWNKGWGSVQVALSASAAVSGPLYARLHNAGDAAATSTAGTGAVLQAGVQVGTVGLGTAATTVSFSLPAGPYFYYVDLSLAADMSNAVRIATPVGVGSVAVMTGQSIASCWLMNLGGGTLAAASAATGLAVVPGGVVYAPLSLTPAGPAGVWEVPSDGGDYTSAFSAEYLRLKTAQLGVVCAQIGHANPGKPIRNWEPASGADYASLKTVLVRAGWKFDAFYWVQGSQDTATLTPRAVYQAKLQAVLADVAANVAAAATARGEGAVPYLTILAPVPAGAGLLGGTDARHIAWIQEIRLAGQAIAAADTTGRVAYLGAMDMIGAPHPSWQGNMLAARDCYRLEMGMRGVAGGGFVRRDGPALTGVASRAGGSTDILLAVAQNGGTALSAVSFSSSTLAMSTSVTSAQLATQFEVFPAGQDRSTGATLAFASTNPVTLVDASTIRLRLASVPADGVALDVYYRYGNDASATAVTSVAIVDNVTDADGISYGRQLQPRLVPVFVAAPSPAAASVVVTAVGGSMLAEGQTTPVTATYTGPPPTGAEASLDGGAFAAVAATTGNGGAISYTLAAAPAAGSHTLRLRLRPSGAVSPAFSFSTVTLASALAAAGVSSGVAASRLLHVDTSQAGTLWADAARSTLASGPNARVQGLSDLSGAGNHLAQAAGGLAPLLWPLAQNGLPGLEFVLTTGSYLELAGSTLPATLKGGSFTVLTCLQMQQVGTFAGAFYAGPGLNETVNNLLIGNYGGYAAAWRSGNTAPYAKAQDTVLHTNIERVSVGGYAMTHQVSRFDTSTGLMDIKTYGLTSSGSTFTLGSTTASSAGGTAGLTTGVAWSKLWLGRGGVTANGYGGLLFEVIVVPAAVSDADREALLAYATAKWGT